MDGATVEQLDLRGKPRVQTHFHDVSLTVQSDAHNAEINEIIRKFSQGGMLDNLNMAEAVFQDITEFTDFADAMLHAKMAEADFLKLPSKIREIFNHDVAEWLDAAHDQEKRDALVAAGVIDAPPDTGEAIVAGLGETKDPPGGSGGVDGETPAE